MHPKMFARYLFVLFSIMRCIHAASTSSTAYTTDPSEISGLAGLAYDVSASKEQVSKSAEDQDLDVAVHHNAVASANVPSASTIGDHCHFIIQPIACLAQRPQCTWSLRHGCVKKTTSPGFFKQIRGMFSSQKNVEPAAMEIKGATSLEREPLRWEGGMLRGGTEDWTADDFELSNRRISILNKRISMLNNAVQSPQSSSSSSDSSSSGSDESSSSSSSDSSSESETKAYAESKDQVAVKLK